MKKLIVFLMVLGFFVGGSGLAQADISWQTAPVLGFNIHYPAGGDIVVDTGPIPITIPHYSIPGDPLYGVGSPSMTYFLINPNVWGGVHWYDPNVWTYSGSMVNLEVGNTYSYTGVYDFLGTPGYPAYPVLAAAATFTADWSNRGLGTGIGEYWAEDVGNWTYTETWTDMTDNIVISSVRSYTVGVPEPATMLLLGSGLIGLAGFARRKFKK